MPTRYSNKPKNTHTQNQPQRTNFGVMAANQSQFWLDRILPVLLRCWQWHLGSTSWQGRTVYIKQYQASKCPLVPSLIGALFPPVVCMYMGCGIIPILSHRPHFPTHRHLDLAECPLHGLPRTAQDFVALLAVPTVAAAVTLPTTSASTATSTAATVAVFFYCGAGPGVAGRGDSSWTATTCIGLFVHCLRVDQTLPVSLGSGRPF